VARRCAFGARRGLRQSRCFGLRGRGSVASGRWRQRRLDDHAHAARGRLGGSFCSGRGCGLRCTGAEHRFLRRQGSDGASGFPSGARHPRHVGRRSDVRDRLDAEYVGSGRRFRSLRVRGSLGLWRRLRLDQRLCLGLGAISLRSLGSARGARMVVDSWARVRARLGRVEDGRRVSGLGARASAFRMAGRGRHHRRLRAALTALRFLRSRRSLLASTRACRAHGTARGRDCREDARLRPAGSQWALPAWASPCIPAHRAGEDCAGDGRRARVRPRPGFRPSLHRSAPRSPSARDSASERRRARASQRGRRAPAPLAAPREAHRDAWAHRALAKSASHPRARAALGTAKARDSEAKEVALTE